MRRTPRLLLAFLLWWEITATLISLGASAASKGDPSFLTLFMALGVGVPLGMVLGALWVCGLIWLIAKVTE